MSSHPFIRILKLTHFISYVERGNCKNHIHIQTITDDLVETISSLNMHGTGVFGHLNPEKLILKTD